MTWKRICSCLFIRLLILLSTQAVSGFVFKVSGCTWEVGVATGLKGLLPQFFVSQGSFHMCFQMYISLIRPDFGRWIDLYSLSAPFLFLDISTFYIRWKGEAVRDTKRTVLHLTFIPVRHHWTEEFIWNALMKCCRRENDRLYLQHSHLMSWLYLASLSDLQGAPVLICNREVAKIRTNEEETKENTQLGGNIKKRSQSDERHFSLCRSLQTLCM